MHRRVAQLLEPLAADPTIAAELAHHASLAGEALLGVRACIAAGHHALRLFANDDAEALARRGLRLAEELEEPSRVEAALDLLEVQYAARAPDRDEAAARVRILAERALDFGLARSARQGFQMVSYLRWAGSSLADAHANILQAERVSRLAEPGERAVALAQAARCLVLLERNLQQAEAFMLEADAVSRRQGRTSAAVAFGLGMIAARRGETAEAAEAFIAARDLARQQGEHLAEFMAIEHHVMLEIDQGRHKLAETLAADLVELGARVRPGAEAHIARALHSLARLQGGAEDDEGMRQAADAVRRADAKFELSYVLARWAEVALKQEREEATRAIATEALEIAQAMGRSSEIGDSLVLLAEVAQRRGERGEFRRRLEQLEKLGVRDLSARSRQRIAAVTKSIRPAAGRRSNPVAASSRT